MEKFEDAGSRSPSSKADTDGAPRPRLITPVLRTFLAGMILANVSGMMFYPLLALYLRELDAGVEEVGLFFTLSMIAPLVLQIAGGWISDHIGRIKAIALGSIGGALSWIGILLSPSWGWVLASESVGAIASAFVAPSFDAFIAEQSSEGNRAKTFAVSQSIYEVVTVVGPLAGGLTVRFLGWRSLLWIAAVLYFGATAVRLSMARKTAPLPRREGLNIKSFGTSLKVVLGMALSGGVVTWLILSDGGRDIAMGMSMQLFPLFLREIRGVDVAAIGLFNSLFGMASMAIMLPSGFLADRYGERYPIAAGYLLAFLSFGLLVFVPAPWLAGAAFCLALGAGMGLMQPAYQSLISKAVPERYRGITYGFLSTSNGLVALPAPWLGALLWKRVAPAAPFFLTAALTLALVPLVMAKFRPAALGADPAGDSAGRTPGPGNLDEDRTAR